ncbi:MAG: SulP family inorganic anion transporter [Gammaproteobacteria bacterium]
MRHDLNYFLENLRNDIPASIVVFLVALPLCLGIALASGAPLFAGIIAGVVGGLMVSWASGSQLSVSGPAAGLTVIIFNAITTLGSYQAFIVSVVLAGILQLVMGFFKAGLIGAFFPGAVIKGMLAAIGLILIIKQIPHATGYHELPEGDESYMQISAEESFFELLGSLVTITPGVTVVSIVSLLILIVWESAWVKRFTWPRLIPGPLLAVIWGITFNLTARRFAPEWSISEEHLVNLPEIKGIADFIAQLQRPDFSYLVTSDVYKIAVTLAIIGSLETLLSIEAVDKLDPLKRVAPPNRELKAQGLGNILSGMLGGLPITAVIVRSAANINAGGKTRLSCFMHGVLLLLSVVFFSRYLNAIPLGCLAAILLQTGYKLAKPSLFLEFYRQGWNQFLPFTITVIAILLTDLLQGIAIGMGCGIFFVLRANFHAAMTLTQSESRYLLRLHKDVSFLNKALLRRYLNSVREESELIIDGSKALFIDHDILETISDFLQAAPEKNINVELQGFVVSRPGVPNLAKK